MNINVALSRIVAEKISPMKMALPTGKKGGVAMERLPGNSRNEQQGMPTTPRYDFPDNFPVYNAGPGLSIKSERTWHAWARFFWRETSLGAKGRECQRNPDCEQVSQNLKKS
jgi:hypothetical protein